MAHSLLLAAPKVGMDITVATPPGFEPNAGDCEYGAERCVALPESKLTVTQDPAAAATDASAIYTDVWASMGQEEDADRRLALFRRFQG